jgi:hypothetical protein
MRCRTANITSRTTTTIPNTFTQRGVPVSSSLLESDGGIKNFDNSPSADGRAWPGLARQIGVDFTYRGRDRTADGRSSAAAAVPSSRIMT